MARIDDHDLPVFVCWMEFLKWLFPVTEKFPKRIRFTLVDRMQNLAFDVVEDMVEARYSRDKRAILKKANLRLEKLRVLMRIAHAEKYLSHAAYQHASRTLNEAGRMLGGWIKQQEQR